MIKKILEVLKYLDPFYYVDRFIAPLLNPEKNEIKELAINIIFAFLFAWLFLTVLGFILRTEMPISVVMSQSMEPVLNRGDLIILGKADKINVQKIEVGKYLKNKYFDLFGKAHYTEKDGDISLDYLEINGKKIELDKKGDIVVYWSDLRNKAIIHRAVLEIDALDGSYYLTKGDSKRNKTFDQDCGAVINGVPEKICIAKYPVPKKEIKGKVIGVVPFIGCIKIWISEDIPSLLFQGKLPKYFHGFC